MATAPLLTFRDPANPANILSSISFAQSTLGTDFLPVVQGESSVPVKVRVYNNYILSTGIASAFNVNVTVYDGIGAGSHTAAQSVAAQSWIRVFESGFGENSTTMNRYTAWQGSDTAIGGSNAYFAEVGSDGLFSDQIRAGTNQNGIGFIEFELYAQVPDLAGSATYMFAFSVAYEWIT